MLNQSRPKHTLQSFSRSRLLYGSAFTVKRYLYQKTACFFVVAILASFPVHSMVPDKAIRPHSEGMSVTDLKFNASDESVVDRSIGLEYLLPLLQPEGISEEISELFADADGGDSDAQYALYWLYLEGDYIVRDEAQALVWLRKAAEQKHSDAIYTLAIHYYNGELIEKNYKKARLLFEQAAAAGIDTANTNLGIIYEQGLGTTPSLSRAKQHYQSAAEAGEPYAENELGRLLMEEHKYQLALQWLQKSAGQNIAQAKYNIGLMKEYGLGTARDKQAAFLLYEEAAAAQIPKAIAAKGRILLFGLGGKVDLVQARLLLIKAYKAGDKTAALSLLALEPADDKAWVNDDDIGRLLSVGVLQNEPLATISMGVRHLLFARNDKDRQTGLKLIETVAEGGNLVAQYLLGKIYNFGLAVPADFAKAARWYRAAASNGMYAAKYRLAHLYYRGQGVEKDLKKFIGLLTEVAKSGSQLARYDLAVAHRNGEGVRKNQALGLRKFRELAEEGMPLARYELARIYALKNSGVTDEKKARYWLIQLLQGGVPSFQVKAADIYADLLGDYEAALPLYQEAADRGDSDAINSLGVMYKLGQGVKTDWDKAIDLYKQAADMGNAIAMNNYGYAFLIGEGVDQDYLEALKWFRLSAEKNYAMAQNNMGHMYHSGLGGVVDYQKAREWYEKAAAQNYPDAVHNLGVVYLTGHGAKKDPARAEKLFRKAAAAGYPKAIKLVEKYDEEDRVLEFANSGQMTPYEMWFQANDYLYGLNGRSLNLSLGLNLAMKSMEAGYEQAYLLVATLYEKGLAVEADSQKAITYLKNAAADIGSYDAMKRLASYYQEGMYVVKNECTAVDWYWKMSLAGGDQGPGVINLMLETPLCDDKSRKETMLRLQKLVDQQEPDATCLLGMLHSIGVGVEKSESKSLELQIKAAELGSHHCQTRVGVFYATGQGVTKDRSKARLWFKKAAQAGSVNAFQNFAYFLLTGPARERDFVEIYKWYWLSIESGKPENKNMLQKLEKYMNPDEIGEAKTRGKNWQKNRAIRNRKISRS